MLMVQDISNRQWNGSDMAGESVELFISYSHKDEALRDELETHLAILKRQGAIETWHDRKIGAGTEWANQIDDNLKKADIILLLISSYFLASDYCYDIELKLAMERHEAGEALVVPIILRPVDWSGAPFGKLQAFPKDAKAITTWTNKHEAFMNVAQGIRTAAERLLEQRRQKFQLRYRKEVERFASRGEISRIGRMALDELRKQLGVSSEEANTIEEEVLQTYREYQQNLQLYEQAFVELIERDRPLGDVTRIELNQLQQVFGLTDEDVASIEAILASPKAEPVKQLEQQLEKPLNSPETLPKPQSEVKKPQQSTENNERLVSQPAQMRVVAPEPPPVAEIPRKLTEDQERLASQPTEMRVVAPEPSPKAKTPQQSTEDQERFVSQPAQMVVVTSEPLPAAETSTALDPEFLERCRRELTRHIGPVAGFVLKQTLTQYPQIVPQQMVEVLAAEIPDPQEVQEFKENLR